MATLFDSLFSLFSGDEASQQAFADSPEGYFEQNGLLNVTSADIQSEMPRVLTALQGQSGDVNQGGFANFANSGNVVLPPPPAHADYHDAPDGGGLAGAIETVNHYTSVFNETNQDFQDNDTTVIDDRDTTTDNSVNQNITAFGDVSQEFDNDVVSGDGAIAAGDNSQNNTGDGAVQAGDDIEDSTIATGDVGGSVTGDVEDSIVGDGNTAIIDSEIDDSALSFGEGDAINDSNVLEGDGVLQNDIGGDANAAANTGSGTQNVVQDSELDESAVGGSVESNDIDIDADDGSSVAFGEGADSDSGDTSVSGVDGNVQVAGDDSTQVANNDESVEINDSYNDESINDSFNDQSVDASINDSGNIDASDDDGVDFDDNDLVDVDNSPVDASDDDGIDVL
jgi:hypothetical protein